VIGIGDTQFVFEVVGEAPPRTPTQPEDSSITGMIRDLDAPDARRQDQHGERAQ
jgi:hypothetical protein